MIINFLTAYFIIVIIGIIYSKMKILKSDNFWLLFWWILIIGVYLTAEVDWGNYRVKYNTWVYIAITFLLYFSARFIGTRFYKGDPNISRASTIINTKILKNLIYFGIAGVLVFCLDYLRLNSFGIKKSSYNISIFGAAASLVFPITLVIGLFLIAEKYLKLKKISIKGLILIACYTIPGVLNSGRESLINVFISCLVVILSAMSIKSKKNKFSKIIKINKGVVGKFVLILVSLVGITVLIDTTVTRFSTNEINTYINTHSVSLETINSISSLGKYSFLIYHIISYFGHQIPYLQFIIRDYRGPYLFGLFELNIISRRLPEFLGLDYKSVFNNITRLSGNTFSGSWPTLLGSLIFDFSKYLAPIIVLLIGYYVGKANKNYILAMRSNSEYRIVYIVLRALICSSMLSTIQMGPFYNISIYGCYIWIYIVYKIIYKKSVTNSGDYNH